MDDRIHSYRIIDLIGSGSYGNVYKAVHATTGCIVAIKVISIMSLENGLPIEVKYLVKYRNCKNIINLIEHFYSNDDKLVLVFEYMEYDLWKFISPKNRHMNLPCVKYFIYQLLVGLNQLHSQKIMHLDIKPANLLVDQCFQLKIADFGFTTFKGNPQLTNQVISLFYRPPELLMGSKEYGTEVDIWSVGCILVEMLTGFYLFAGSSEDAQLDLIFKTMGTPNEKNWPGVSKLPGYSTFAHNKSKRYPYRSLKELGKFKYFSNATLDFILRMLAMNPMDRINCSDALVHPWFKEDPEPHSPSPYIIQSLVSRPIKNNNNNNNNNSILKNGINIAPKSNHHHNNNNNSNNIYSPQHKNHKQEIDKIFKSLSDHKIGQIEKTKYFNNLVIAYNKKLEQRTNNTSSNSNLQSNPQTTPPPPQQQSLPNNNNSSGSNNSTSSNNSNNNIIIQKETLKLQELKQEFHQINLHLFNSIQKSQQIYLQIQDLKYQFTLRQIDIEFQPQMINQLQLQQQQIKSRIVELGKEKEELHQQKNKYEHHLFKLTNDINQLDTTIRQRKLQDYKQQLKYQQEVQRQKYYQAQQEEIARQKKSQQEKFQLETYKYIKVIEEKNSKVFQNFDNDMKLIERELQLYLFNHQIDNIYLKHSKLLIGIDNINYNNNNISSNSSNQFINFTPIPGNIYQKYKDVLDRQKNEAQQQYEYLKSIHTKLSQPETMLTTIYKLNQMIYDVEILYIKKQNQITNLLRDQENKLRLVGYLRQMETINDQINERNNSQSQSSINTRYQAQLLKSNNDQIEKRKELTERSIVSLVPLLYKNSSIAIQLQPHNSIQNYNNNTTSNSNQHNNVPPQVNMSSCTTPNFQPLKPINLINNNSNTTVKPIVDSRSSSVSPNSNINNTNPNNISNNSSTTTTTTTTPSSTHNRFQSISSPTFNKFFLQKEEELSSTSTSGSSSITSDDENNIKKSISNSNSMGKIQNGSYINKYNKRSKDSELLVTEALMSSNEKKKSSLTPTVPPTRYQKRLKLLNEQSVPSMKSSSKS